MQKEWLSGFRSAYRWDGRNQIWIGFSHSGKNIISNHPHQTRTQPMNIKALSGEDSELDLIMELVHDLMERGKLDCVSYLLDIVSVALREQFSRDACLCFLVATLPVKDRPEVKEQRQRLSSVFWDENSPREGKTDTEFLLHGL